MTRTLIKNAYTQNVDREKMPRKSNNIRQLWSL